MNLRQPLVMTFNMRQAERNCCSQGCFARRPEEICSLYEGEDSQDEPEMMIDVTVQAEPGPEPQAEPGLASLSLDTAAA